MSQVKLTADSGGGTVSLKGPSSTTSNGAYTLTLPGTANTTLATAADLNALSTGITEADAWRIDTDFDQQSYADITSNWARATWSTGSLHGYLGTGMSQSSGIFTFPSTGYWYIEGRLGYHARTGVSSGVGLYVKGTSDGGSNYFDLVTAWDTAVFQSGYYEWGHMNCSTIIDVTSTSNCKVKFGTEASNNQVKYYSSAGGHNNLFIFIRLGDT
tara:strand:- start:1255 stop:1896 length:642 start_codon:yes stop_codon:yes gene_type:complete